MKLYMDTETRSDVPIKRGVHRYVQGAHFDVLLLTWAVDDGPVRIWNCLREPLPLPLQQALAKADELIFHNSAFDRCVLNRSGILNRRVEPEAIVDTMVQALAHGMPAGLDKLSEAFGLPTDLAKLTSGRKLIQLFCVPRRDKMGAVEFNDWTTHPDQWAEFEEYAMADILAMREVHKRLPKVNYPQMEHKLWCLDQTINDRGIPVDVALAEAAIREAAHEKNRLNRKTAEATDGEVTAATQRDKLIVHLAKQYDVNLPDLRASTLERRIADPDTPADLAHIMDLRLQSSQNAAAKFRRVIEHETGGRLRHTMQMYGAARTGRDAGRVFQPQNLKRPTMWHGLEGKELDKAIEEDVNLIKDGIVDLVYGNQTMEVLGNCVRSVIVAPKGRKLVQADLSNIEGRGLVWLSNETWKLDYFRDFDAGKIKFDNYVMAYAKSMNVVASTVTKDNRQIGKVQELGLGYGGGVAAFITFANVYNLNLQELATAVWESGDQNQLKECLAKYDWAKENGYHAGLTDFQYAACEYLKQKWREAHPQTVTFWGDLETAFKLCISNPDETFTVGRLKFRRAKSWLYIRLPSGRCLVYLSPKLEDGQITFMGQDPFTKQFRRVKTYSGRLAENVTSATARDVLLHRMFDVEKAGYRIVLRVHDELVTEAPDKSNFSSEGLAEIMTRPFQWSDGLPLAAAGFEAYRYRKD